MRTGNGKSATPDAWTCPISRRCTRNSTVPNRDWLTSTPAQGPINATRRCAMSIVPMLRSECRKCASVMRDWSLQIDAALRVRGALGSRSGKATEATD